MVKKILIASLIAFLAIQFFRPEKNLTTAISENDITNRYYVPSEVKKILQTSCFDCHSNHTVYPWYDNVQPLAWFLDHHVKEGKGELNFSEFGAYTPKKAAHKLDEITEEIEHGDMPLSSYTLIHKDAVLNDAEIILVTHWANHLKDSIIAANQLKP